MPEGPQMVFLKEQTEHFVGQKVLEAFGSEKGFPYNNIKEQPLVDIKTYGKEILFCFSEFTLRIHLMLFGKYAINGELNRELRLGLEFETGTINFYACSCRFIQEQLNNLYNWSTDVMHPSFDKHKALEKLCSKPDRLISEALLDQHILAGVGNGIKNEVLFRRHIHPESMVGAIPKIVLEKLVDECVQLSFEYLNWLSEGTADKHWQVYRQKECSRDHIPLRKEKIGKSGRTSYFCDKCQELYLPDAV